MRALADVWDSARRRSIEQLRPRLFRLAHAWCHDAALADDLAQEALVKGLARASQLRDPQALECWLFSILNNCWRDHLRARRNDLGDEALDEWVVDDAEGPEQRYACRQTVQRVRRAIAALPLGQRQVLTLVDIEECSYAQVAQVLDVPVGTVMSRLARARGALRRLLAPTEIGQTRQPAAIRRVK